MAVTLIDATSGSWTGTGADFPMNPNGDIYALRRLTVSIPLPQDVQMDDVVHVAVTIPKSGFRLSDPSVVSTPTVHRTEMGGGGYGIEVPEGWDVVGTQGSSRLLRRIVGAGWPETLDLTVTCRPFRKYTVYVQGRLSSGTTYSSVYADPNWIEVDLAAERVFLMATATSHRGVDLDRIYAAPPLLLDRNGSWNTNAPANSMLVQHRHSWSGLYGEMPEPEPDELPPLPDPLETDREPPEWDVILQESFPPYQTVNDHNRRGGVLSWLVQIPRLAILNTGDYTPGPATAGPDPGRTGSTTVSGTRAWVFALIDPEVVGLPVDPPIEPDQPGVTGSGWVIPEWIDGQKQIETPLLLSVWEELAGELVRVDAGEEPPALGITAWFNGLGVCTNATVTFPIDPGFNPWEHLLKFGLVARGLAEPANWWTGVVSNIRATGGLFEVDLEGIWTIFNEARVQVDEDNLITTPAYALLSGATVLGGGDPTAIEVLEPLDRQQTWGEFLGKTFRINPDAAWGVGPDHMFIMGLPENAGFTDLDADNPVITNLRPGEFILPPFVTEWWAEEEDGSIRNGGLNPPPGLLTPRRLVRSRIGEHDHLLTPAEAWLPKYAGPSYELTVAGIAVPPIRVINLPVGNQMAASARVNVSFGDETSEPRIITTLTTVALPYGNS